jgi:hypothetical protein
VTPAGVKKVFHSGTQFSIAIFRTQLFGPSDIDDVKKVQSGYLGQPLSAYLKQPTPAPMPLIFPNLRKSVRRRTSSNFSTSHCNSRPSNRTKSKSGRSSRALA